MKKRIMCKMLVFFIITLLICGNFVIIINVRADGNRETIGDIFDSSDSDGWIRCWGSDYLGVNEYQEGEVWYHDPSVIVGQSYSSSSDAYYIYRGFVYFQTESLPDDADITSATLSIHVIGIDIDTHFDIRIQSGMPDYPHIPLQSGDYDRDHYGGYSYGGYINTENIELGWNDIDLNSNGIDWINKQGWTKFCLRSARDICQYAPSGSEKISFTSEEFPGSYEAKLTVDYTCSNHPPAKPSTPNGPSELVVGESGTYSTDATDPDPVDIIKYGWDWNGDGDVDEWTGYFNSGETCYRSHSWSSPGTRTVKVIAKDLFGELSEWSDGKTVNVYSDNFPPYVPSNPSPANGATDVDINADISWSGGDPDGDTVYYKIWFGTDPTPNSGEVVKDFDDEYTSTSYNPGTLNYCTTYYWKIQGQDNHGLSGGVSSVWDFTTTSGPNYPPDPPTGLLCEGETNPQDVTDYRPEYSAIFNDQNIEDVATKYKIEIGTDMDWDNGAEISYWVDSCSVEVGERIPDIEYQGYPIHTSYENYYWRIRFYDGDAWGYWSNTANYKTGFIDEFFTVADEQQLSKYVYIDNIKQPEEMFDILCEPWNGGDSVYDFGYTYNVPFPLISGRNHIYDEAHPSFPIMQNLKLASRAGKTYTVPVEEPGVSEGTNHRGTVSVKCDTYHKWLGVSLFLGISYMDFWLIIQEENEVYRHLNLDHEELYWWNPFDKEGVDELRGEKEIIIDESLDHEDTIEVDLKEGVTYTFWILSSSRTTTYEAWIPYIGLVQGRARSELWPDGCEIKIHWTDDGTRDDNNPPSKPSTPSSPSNRGGVDGKVGEIITLCTNSTDDDGDPIYYKWYWGDGSASELLGPFGSGEIIEANHSWDYPGPYEVCVEAYDDHEWSGLSEVEVVGINRTDGFIEIVSPSGGEEWNTGEIHEIIWNSFGYVGDEVVIGLLKDDELNQTVSGDTPIPNNGSYEWRVTPGLESGDNYSIAIYSLANISFSNEFTIIYMNCPPEAPSISGEENPKVRRLHEYTACAVDLEGDDVSYLFDWGDGTTSGWTEFVSSGTEVEKRHFWLLSGEYTIRVQAKDEYGDLSEWSEFDIEVSIDGSCFLAGTQITMVDGSNKNIEDIKVGDLVKSYDSVQQKQIVGIVTKTLHHTPEEMTDYYLVINENLRVTPNHCLYKDGEYVKAEELAVGDTISTTHTRVQSVRKVFDRVETYDLIVQPFFTGMAGDGGVVIPAIHRAQDDTSRIQRQIAYYADGFLSVKFDVDSSNPSHDGDIEPC